MGQKIMTNRMHFLKDLLHDLKDRNLYSELPVLGTEQKNRVILNGKEVIIMCPNNYLGFPNHPRLREEAKKAIDKWGFGTGAVRQIAGTMEIHIALEEMLAEYKHTESSLVFVAGIAANRGTIQALMGEEDAIISDELNHGSIIDGVRLTKSKRMVYPHLDMEGLKKAFVETKDARRRLT